MSALRSPALLRTLLCDLSAELAAINSTTLPDGATAFDNQSDTLWRLDKAASTTYDALIGSGLLLKPDDDTAARWFAEAIAGSSPYNHSSYLNAPVAVTMTSNQWNPLGSTTGDFQLSDGNSALFTLSPTTGLITYNGPARLALVTMSASLNNGSSATSIAVHAAISRAGDVVAGSTNNYPSKGEQAANIINTLSLITVSRIVLLNPSTTLQLSLRNATNGDDLVATYYQATVAPL